MHAEYNCPGCGMEFGNMTSHPASDRKCADCLAGKWGGGIPEYVPGKGGPEQFLSFLKDQAAQGIQRAKDLLAKMQPQAVVDPAGPMLDMGKVEGPETRAEVPEIN